MSTPSKDRSAGITIAAAALFICSGFGLLLSLLTVVAGFVLRKMPVPSAEMPPGMGLTANLAIAGLMYLGFSIWGFTTGAGLLKLKSWARASVLVIAALLLAGAVSGGAGLAILAPVLPARPGAPPFSTLLPVLLGILAVPAAIGIWWLAYFNTRSAREQFADSLTTGHYSAQDGSSKTLFLRPPRPVSITLIALLYLMSLPFLVIAPFRDFPVIFFGARIAGNGARAIYVLYVFACLYVGIGLLKLQPPARLVAIGLSFVHVVSGAVFALLPGFEARMERVLAELVSPIPPVLTVARLMPLVRFATVLGLIFPLAIIWALARAKEAFRPSAERRDE